MKILYIDNTAQWCNYYKDIVETLKVNNDVLVKTTELSETVSTFKPDVVIIGFGITNKTISSLKVADGLVVGSQLCKTITNSIKKKPKSCHKCL